jgi:hypothetical protein
MANALRDPNQLAKSIVDIATGEKLDDPMPAPDIVAMLEQWELANFKPEYQFMGRQYAIGKGHSVSVLWRGGEVDMIFGFEKEDDALEWIRDKSQAWLLEQKTG